MCVWSIWNLSVFRCQFIISTHSPFLLSIQDACIYDLDTEPVQTRQWTELANVRLYYDLFKEHVQGTCGGVQIENNFAALAVSGLTQF